MNLRLKPLCIILLFLFSRAPILVGQNLIVNPGAELDPITNGWTQVSGFWESGVEVIAHGGSYHFYAGDNSISGGELYQDVNVSAFATSIDAGLSTFTFTSWMRVYNFPGVWNDQSRVIVEYRDIGGTILSTYDSGLRNTLTWISYTDARTAPAGTRTIRIRMLANRLSGTASDGYFDDLSLTHSSTLPVSLLFFDVYSTDKYVHLIWETATEESNAYYTIERSQDATAWEAIGTVEGASYSTQLTSYSFTDHTPKENLVYYRLVQTDHDGEKTNYAPAKSNYNSSSPLQLFPNPTTGVSTLVSSENTSASIAVFSLTGQPVLLIDNSSGPIHTLDFSSLSQGTYLVEYIGGEKKSSIVLQKK